MLAEVAGTVGQLSLEAPDFAGRSLLSAECTLVEGLNGCSGATKFVVGCGAEPVVLRS